MNKIEAIESMSKCVDDVRSVVRSNPPEMVNVEFLAEYMKRTASRVLAETWDSDDETRLAMLERHGIEIK